MNLKLTKTASGFRTHLFPGQIFPTKEAVLAELQKVVEAKKKGKAVNPWAVCTKSVGRDDKEKYERCVMDVKEKHPVKE